MTDLVVFDIDGVVRHFDPSVQHKLEDAHGLARGALWRAAFEHPRGHAVITGGVSRAAWIGAIGSDLGAPDAPRRWLSTPGNIDSAMTGLIAELRTAGRRVVALTNGTDTIAAELERDGLADAFDEVYCSAFIGAAKPSAEIFDHLCRTEGVDPAAVLFFDDSDRNVDGARAFGIDAHVFASADACAAVLAADPDQPAMGVPE